jgi:hypothetical protein
VFYLHFHFFPSFFFFSPVLRLEPSTSAGRLLGRHSTAWATLPALFALLGFFLLFVCSRVWTQSLHLEHFFVMGLFEIGSCKLFARAGFEKTFLLISASWVARITGVSHHHSATVYFLEIRCHFLLIPVWTRIFLFYASLCLWDDKCVPPHPETEGSVK